MVLLETEQLLLQGLHLGLQVSFAQGQLVQDPAQAVGVALHQLPQGQLRLVPAGGQGQQQVVRLNTELRGDLELLALFQLCKINGKLPEARAGREGSPIPWPDSLGPEVVGSQFGIIDVHDHPGVLCLGA